MPTMCIHLQQRVCLLCKCVRCSCVKAQQCQYEVDFQKIKYEMANISEKKWLQS